MHDGSELLITAGRELLDANGELGPEAFEAAVRRQVNLSKTNCPVYNLEPTITFDVIGVVSACGVLKT